MRHIKCKPDELEDELYIEQELVPYFRDWLEQILNYGFTVFDYHANYFVLVSRFRDDYFRLNELSAEEAMTFIKLLRREK